jgi:predicted nucleic acid-binding protein
MDILIDANIAVAIILNEPTKSSIIKATVGHDVVSTEILPHEVGNALTALYKRKHLTGEQVQEAFVRFERIPLRLIKVNIGAALDIACTCRIYAYDAYYLELARRLRLPLLTLDKQMKQNGKTMQLDMLEV